MKKTTAYSRNRKNKPANSESHASALARTVGRCGTYADLHEAHAKGLLAELDKCLLRLKDGTELPATHVSHDELMKALSTARTRSIHITGSSDNFAWPIFSAGLGALSRALTRRDGGAGWLLEPAEVLTLQDALDAYSVVLLASSPLQMQIAWDAYHIELLRELDEIEKKRFTELPV